MIGGNGFNLDHEEANLPTKELFIRWVQANTFLPAMQFSFVPWQFDNEVRKPITQQQQNRTPKCFKSTSQHIIGLISVYHVDKYKLFINT